jgi:hypothetical protein
MSLTDVDSDLGPDQYVQFKHFHCHRKPTNHPQCFRPYPAILTEQTKAPGSAHRRLFHPARNALPHALHTGFYSRPVRSPRCTAAFAMPWVGKAQFSWPWSSRPLGTLRVGYQGAWRCSLLPDSYVVIVYIAFSYEEVNIVRRHGRRRNDHFFSASSFVLLSSVWLTWRTNLGSSSMTCIAYE